MFDQLVITSVRVDFQPLYRGGGIEARTISKCQSDFYISQHPQGHVNAKFDNNTDYPTITNEYDLVVNVETFLQLGQIFPNITSLTVVAINFPYNIQSTVPAQLCGLWPNLTELTVIGQRSIRIDTIPALNQVINRLNSLRSLSIDAFPMLLSWLPCLDRLDHLSMRLTKEGGCISQDRMEQYQRTLFELLDKYPNIRTVGLWIDDGNSYIDFTRWPATVCDRVIKLVYLYPNSICFDFIYERDLTMIRSKFTSLTYLQYGKASNVSTMSTTLSLLSSLVNLKEVTFAFNGRLPATNCLAAIWRWLTRVNLRLESVRKVHLMAKLDPHQLAPIWNYFPNSNELSYAIDSSELARYRDKWLCKVDCDNCTQLRQLSTLPWTNSKCIIFNFDSNGLIYKIDNYSNYYTY